jgi:hypothetical protein
MPFLPLCGSPGRNADVIPDLFLNGTDSTALVVLYSILHNRRIAIFLEPLSAAGAFKRIEAFVAETIEPKLRPSELMMARQQIGPFLGLVDLPDNILTNNPYGVAFSLGRREQLNMSSAELRLAWDALTDEQLREVAKKVFAPDRHAGAFIAVEK